MENLYLLAILPNEELSRQIHAIREECALKFNVKAALKPPVHITLHRPFKLEPGLERSLLRVLAPAAALAPFDLDIENFSSFHTHTLFIPVARTISLSMLHRKISAVFTRNKFDPKETKSGGSSFTPHITIAYRDVTPGIFPLIWEEFKDRKFKRSFTCDHFTLLKHDGKCWKVFREYPLQPVPQTQSLF